MLDLGWVGDERKQDVAYRRLLRFDPCSYCGGTAGQVDHVQPSACGGEDAWTNFTAACRSCNARKATSNARKATKTMLAAISGLQVGKDSWARQWDRYELSWAIEGGYLANFIERKAA